jgi:propionyl-CoA synthetase
MISSNYINLTTFPTKLGSATKPCPGWDVKIMDDDDNLVDEPEKPGKIMVKLPCPPGHMDGLWGNDQAYVEKYLSNPKGYYLTGDAGYIDKDGYVYIMTRTDDVINTAGHRISTGRIEEVLAEHPNVAENAVVGKDDPLKGDVPLAFVVIQKEIDRTKMAKELQAIVREKVGAFAKLDNVIFIQRLPKTRSGKILRNLLRDISNGIKTPRVTPTIEDRAVVPEIMKAYADTVAPSKE